MNFLKNDSKQQKSIVQLYVAQFEEKKVFVNNSLILLIYQKTLFKKFKFYKGFAPFQTS